MELRPYQQDGVNEIRAAMTECRRVLYTAPTGAGKTVIFGYIAKQASRKLQRGQHAVILVHRKELVSQTSRTLAESSVQHGIIAAGVSCDLTQPIQVASVQTLAARKPPLNPRLIIIDEAHHAVSSTWREVIKRYPTARVLGVTATPERLDGKGLGDIFERLVHGPDVGWLIENGYLTRPVYYSIDHDLGTLHKTAGDYNRRESEAAVSTPKIVGDAVEHYRRLADGEPAISFSPTIQHAEQVAQRFRDAGYHWDVIDGKLADGPRRQRVLDLASGKLHGLSSCEIVSEGFDLPRVSVAILLRPTASLGLHLQQLGRALRRSEGKTRALILDHVGNLRRHGLAEDKRDWTLEGEAAKRAREKQGTGEAIRQCPSCYLMHKPSPECPACGHRYQAKQIKETAGELVLLGGSVQSAKLTLPPLREAIARCSTLADLHELAEQRKYSKGWAWRVWNARVVRSGRTLSKISQDVEKMIFD